MQAFSISSFGTVGVRSTVRASTLALFGWLLLTPVLFAEKAEIKMLIAQNQLSHAKDVLKIKARDNPELHVGFFDTEQALLDGWKLILRARMETKAGKKGKKDADTVVKLRGADQPEGNFPNLETESDWVGPEDPKTSYSIKVEDVDEAKMRDVLDMKLPLDQILTAEQKAFAAKAAGLMEKEFPWADLRLYGLIEVWKMNGTLGKVKEDVTVELWRLTRGTAQMELLEISIKTGRKNSKDKRPVEEIAKEFYEEAEARGLGHATGESKTQQVIKFFKPGTK